MHTLIRSLGKRAIRTYCSFQTMRGGRERRIASEAACTRRDVCSCHARVAYVTPVDSSLLIACLKAVEGLLNCRPCRGQASASCCNSFPSQNRSKKRQPHTTLPSGSTMSARRRRLFERSVPLPRHTRGWCSISPLLVGRCCGLWARHLWPPAVSSQACLFFFFFFFFLCFFRDPRPVVNEPPHKSSKVSL